MSPAQLREEEERERLLYAPLADVGGLLYDKDAGYIDIPDWKVSSQPAPSQCNGILLEILKQVVHDSLCRHFWNHG